MTAVSEFYLWDSNGMARKQGGQLQVQYRSLDRMER